MIPSLPSVCLLAASVFTFAQDQAVAAQDSVPQTQVFGWGTGQLLPDIELPRIDGQGNMRLSSLRGQRVILIQFASW
ncbi:MAG: hypothetical protein ACI841_003520, partial [Planctomycetota bacterium]